MNNIIVNEPVDILLKIGMNYIKQNRKSIIKIPNLTNKTYYVGLGITCYYEAYNGTFEDISSLKRTEDVIISRIDNEGQIYTIKAGFRLSTAKLKYNYYKLTMLGLITISGNVLVIIDGLAIAVKLFINNKCTSNMYPCTWVKVQVTEVGKINIEITGLGPFNTSISNLIIQKITESQEKIIKKIEVYVEDFIKEQLNN